MVSKEGKEGDVRNDDVVTAMIGKCKKRYQIPEVGNRTGPGEMVLGVRAREGGPAACVCWSLLSIGNLSLSKPRGRGTKQEKESRTVSV